MRPRQKSAAGSVRPASPAVYVVFGCLLALLLMSCGGGGSSPAPAPPPPSTTPDPMDPPPPIVIEPKVRPPKPIIPLAVLTPNPRSLPPSSARVVEPQAFVEVTSQERAEYNTHPQFKLDKALGDIGADWLYARAKKNPTRAIGGGTGKGVLVGISDSGLDHTHKIFAGRVDKRSRLTYDLPAEEVAAECHVYPKDRERNKQWDCPITGDNTYVLAQDPDDPDYGKSEVELIKRYPVLTPSCTLPKSKDEKCIRVLRRPDGSLGELPTTLKGECDQIEGTKKQVPPCPSPHTAFDGDNLSHATKIASVMMGRRLAPKNVDMLSGDGADLRGAAFRHGVAYDAKVLNFSTRLNLLPNSATDKGNINSGLLRATRFFNGRADVVNLSALPDTTDVNALSRRVAASFAQRETHPSERTIYVLVAGNRELETDSAEPNIWAQAVHYYKSLQKNLITVVALRENGKIQDHSRHCQKAKTNCIGAPNDHYFFATPVRYFGGDKKLYLRSLPSGSTSFAAPFVAGSLAALMSYFQLKFTDGKVYRQLGNDELVQRIFATAKKGKLDNEECRANPTDEECDYSNEEIYGQGALDLKAASAPVSTLTLAQGQSVDGTRIALAQSGLYVGGAFGDALTRAFADKFLLTLDSLDAPFPRRFTDLLQPNVIETGFQQAYKNWLTPPIAEWHNDARLGVRFGLSSVPFANGNQSPVRDAYFVEAPISDKMRLHSSYGLHPLWAWQPEGAGHFATQPDMFLPALLRDNYGASLALQAGRVGALWFRGTAGNFVAESVMRQKNPRAENWGMMGQFILHHKSQSRLQFGVLREADALANTAGMGGLAFGGGGLSWLLGGQSRITLPAKNWALLASAYMGLTEHTGETNALVRDISPIITSQASIALQGQRLLHPRDVLSLYIAQPMRVESGSAIFHLPVGRTQQRRILRENIAVDLEPSGRTIEIGINYTRPMGRGFLRASFGAKNDVNHQRSNGTETAMFLHYSLGF